jgi:hypothetical protein
MEGAPVSEMKLAFVAVSGERPAKASASVVEKRRERCEIAIGKFDCEMYDTHGTKSWLSVQWPGLPVRTKGNIIDAELVEFDLGHDAMKFYRKVGNYSVIEMTTLVAGMNMETTMRHEVLSVANGKAKVKFTTTTQGNAFDHEMEMDVPEAEAPFMPYDGQVEESITTPAGTFRCIKTDVQGTTMWMHHGVIVKMTMKNNASEATQELIELKME